MDKYFIIREDGSSLFLLPYPLDFCIHCLFHLIETGEKFRLLCFSESSLSRIQTEQRTKKSISLLPVTELLGL